MTEAELWAAWRLWMIVGGLVVLVAAALLVTIWLTARSIVAQARRAARAAEAIRAFSRPTWELQTTNEVAEDLLSTVRAIEARATQLVSVLEGHVGAGGRARGRP